MDISSNKQNLAREDLVIANAASNIEQVLETAPHTAAVIRPPTTNHDNY